MVALVSVAQFAPQILLAPVAGPLADRSSRGRLVSYGRVFCIAGSGALAVWVAITGVGALPIGAVLATSFVTGAGFAISGPAMQAMVPDLVEPHEVGRAVGIDSFPIMLGRAVGPALGGLMSAYAGPAIALGFATFGHIVFGVVALLIARNDAARSPAGEGGRFRDGLAYIKHHPVVAVLLLGVTAVGLGADPVVTLAPALAHDLGSTDALVGYIGSAFGVGALIGSAIATTIGPRTREWAPSSGLLVLGLGLALAPAGGGAWSLCIGFLLAGIGFTVALSGCTTMLHQSVPVTMRGRIMSLWVIAFMGTRPVASVINGVLADSIGAGWAMVALGGFVVAVAALALPASLRRARRD